MSAAPSAASWDGRGTTLAAGQGAGAGRWQGDSARPAAAVLHPCDQPALLALLLGDLRRLRAAPAGRALTAPPRDPAAPADPSPDRVCPRRRLRRRHAARRPRSPPVVGAPRLRRAPADGDHALRRGCHRHTGVLRGGRAPRPAPEVRLWGALLVFAALLRMVIMPYGGFPTDIGTFKGWATALAERGPEAFYGSGFADYLPGYLYVLWLIGELHAHLRFNEQRLLFLIKLPAAAADLLGAALLRRVAGTFTSSRVALLLAALYLFHPALVFTGSYWGP